MNLIRWLRADDAIDEDHTSDDHLDHEKARIRALCNNLDLQQNGTFADFLVTETKGRAASVQDAMKGLESKAATEIAVLATIMGALAIFGQTASARGGLTPWLYCALFFTVSAFVSNVAVLWPYSSEAPSLEEYAATDSLTLPQKAPCLKAEYAMRTLIYARRLAHPNTRKGRWLLIGTSGLVLALVFLIVNYLTQGTVGSISYRTTCQTFKSSVKCITFSNNHNTR